MCVVSEAIRRGNKVYGHIGTQWAAYVNGGKEIASAGGGRGGGRRKASQERENNPKTQSLWLHNLPQSLQEKPFFSKTNFSKE